MRTDWTGGVDQRSLNGDSMVAAGCHHHSSLPRVTACSTPLRTSSHNLPAPHVDVSCRLMACRLERVIACLLTGSRMG